MLKFKNTCNLYCQQGYKRQDNEMYCTSPMMIHKIVPPFDYNYWLKRLDTQHDKPTNQNLRKVPKVVMLSQ